MKNMTVFAAIFAVLLAISVLSFSVFATTASDRNQEYADYADIEHGRIDLIANGIEIEMGLYDYPVAGNYYQIFIDTDNVFGTGYSFADTGAEKLIEYNPSGYLGVYDYIGSGTDWLWTPSSWQQDTSVAVNGKNILFTIARNETWAAMKFNMYTSAGDSLDYGAIKIYPDTPSVPKKYAVYYGWLNATGKTRITVNMTFNGGINENGFFQVFVDKDQLYSTGYKFQGIGADYLVEYHLGATNSYAYTGSGSDWKWDSINLNANTQKTSSVLSVSYDGESNDYIAVYTKLNSKSDTLTRYLRIPDSLTDRKNDATKGIDLTRVVTSYKTSNFDWAKYEFAIIADKNPAEVAKMDTQTYMYLVYGSEYENTDAWELQKKAEIDSYLAYNDGIFFDEVDPAYATDTTNFDTRLASLVNHAKNKNASVIINGLADYALLGNYYMFESFLLSYTGSITNPAYIYTNERYDAAKAQKLKDMGANVITLSYGEYGSSYKQTYGYDGTAKYGFYAYYYSQPDLQKIN